MMTAEDKARVEARVNMGLKDRWYPVAKSVEIRGDRPYGAKLLDQKIVLWRDGTGAIRCIEDFCPHRGAPLSYGEVHGGHIGCRYHGVIVDGTGTVQQVPAMPDCPMEGRKALRAFPVQEASDAVFVYVSDSEDAAPPPLPLPQELSDPAWTGFLCTAVWGVNYRYALDNLADPMHGCYLDAESFTLAFGSKQGLLALDDRANGFRVARVGQVGENFDWTEFALAAGGMFCFLDIPYPPAAAPAGICVSSAISRPKDRAPARCFSGGCARPKGSTAPLGGFSTAPRWKSGIGTCWSKTASCSRRCPTTPATARCCISTTSASRICGGPCTGPPKRRLPPKTPPRVWPPNDPGRPPRWGPRSTPWTCAIRQALRRWPARWAGRCMGW